MATQTAVNTPLYPFNEKGLVFMAPNGPTFATIDPAQTTYTRANTLSSSSQPGVSGVTFLADPNAMA